MPKVRFDLRFTGITTGMWLAREQVELELHQLQRAANDVREIVLSRLRESGHADDEDEVGMAFSEIYFLEGELPRLRRNQLIIPLHAAYEFGVVQLAKYCARRLQLGNQLKGGHRFLDEASRFFRTSCGFPLCDTKERTALTMLFSLRNAIAHANGEVSGLAPSSQKQVQHYAKQVSGISIVNGRLDLSNGFLKDIGLKAESALKGLVKRAEQRF